MRSLRPLILLSVCVTCSIVVAASKLDKADRVVNALLEQEARGEVHHRRDQLGDLVDQTDRARWAAGYVKTADGWQRFDTPQPTDERLRDYETRRGTEPLTAEQHLQLANWCRDQKLIAQERAHLWTASTLSQRSFSEDLLKRLGYLNVSGEWLTEQERKKIAQRESQREQDFRTWLPRANSIHRSLTKVDVRGRSHGQNELNEIHNPRATSALEFSLSKGTPETASAFISWCRSFRSIETTQALARMSVFAAWEPIRYQAAEELHSRPFDHYVPALLALVAKPTEARLVRSSTGLGRGNIVMAFEFQRETWSRVETGAYIVRSTGMQSSRNPSGTVSAATLEGIQQEHNRIDLARALQDEELRRTSQIAEQNRIQQELNNRVSKTLYLTAGVQKNSRPDDLWNWWQDEKASTPIRTSEKQTVSSIEVDEFVPQAAIQQLPGDRFTGMMVEVNETSNTRKECLAAGTTVSSWQGNRMVESLKVGDLVLAKDIDTGELSYKPVIRTTVRSPQPLVTLHTKADSIRATLGHYFWVSGQGWRMAKEIKAGDRLHGVDGTITVTDVSTGGREAVYNLVVEGANTYFVGEGKILSHDVTPPVPTDIIVPGLAAR